jgi:hypothetical protein
MVARRLADLPEALLAACRTGQSSFFDQGTCRWRRLLDTALGNPLALLELPVSLGDLARTVAGTLPVALPLSSRLQTAFAARIKALPPPVYELLLLAVLDGTGDLRLVRAVAADRGGGGAEGPRGVCHQYVRSRMRPHASGRRWS